MIVFRNRVLFLVVLYLLHSADWMGMVHGEPLISVVITEHFYSSGEDITSDLVTYDISKSHCKENGGYVLSAYTKAKRAEVMKDFYNMSYGKDTLFFIGADMEYSVHKEPEPTKRCVYAKPSLNCIIKWNQGVWEDALGDGSGVGFYKGDKGKLYGSGLLNGYEVEVESSWSVHWRPYIVCNKPIPTGFSFLTYNNRGGGTAFEGTSSTCICEVQDHTIKPTRARSEVSGAPDKSDGQSGWSSGLTVVVVLLILLVILAVVLCLYYYGYICRPKADGRRVTEESRAPTLTDREGSAMRRRPENPNIDTASDNVMNPLSGEDRSEIRRNTLIETPQQANAMVRVDGAVPSDSNAAAEQQTRRRRPIRRTRSRMRTLNVSAVEVPTAGEIVGDTTREGH